MRAQVVLAVLALAVRAPVPAAAQVVAHPNQIVGTVRFTNAHPEIRALLDAAGAPGSFSYILLARSVPPAPPLEASTVLSVASRVDRPYEITVESSAEGIAHDVTVVVAGQGSERYRFAAVRPPPVRPEPSPDVVQDVEECAGLVRFTFSSGGAPTTPTGGTIHAWRLAGPGGPMDLPAQAEASIPRDAASADLLVRGDGATYSILVRWTTGTDEESDLIRHEKWLELAVGCDEVIARDCDGGASGGDAFVLGRIVGTFDLVGEDEHVVGGPTWILAAGGPWANERHDRLRREPSSGAFELENLVPSSVLDPPHPYQVFGKYSFGRGRAYHGVQSPWASIEVGDGETVDLGELFVMEPSRVTGGIRLAGPPARPPLGSPLSHLLHVTDPRLDADGDGIPTGPNEARRASYVAAHGVERPGLPAAGRASHVWAGFAGDVDPATAEVDGSYELVVAGLGRAPATWDASEWRLRFETPLPAADEAGVLDASVTVRALGVDPFVLGPGERAELDRAACIGLVRVRFETTDGTFHAPMLDTTSYRLPDGLDFRGMPARHSVGAWGLGAPRDLADAAATGFVLLPLPAGEYVLQPSVAALNPGGGTSRVEVLPVSVKVGCRQVVDGRPEVVVGLSEVGPCADAGLTQVTATVSSLEPIDRAFARVNDGPEIELCRACGVSPVIVGTLPFEDGDNAVTVSVTDALGREAHATAHALFAREPSALDRRPDAPPLTLRREGFEVVLRWEDAGGAPANAYRGTLDSLWRARAYDHAGFGACGIAGGEMRTPLPGPAAYYLVTGTCGWGDTAPGRDSFGRARPGAAERCP